MTRSILEVLTHIKDKTPNPDRRTQYADAYQGKGTKRKPRPVCKQLADYARAMSYAHAAATKEDEKREKEKSK